MANRQRGQHWDQDVWLPGPGSQDCGTRAARGGLCPQSRLRHPHPSSQVPKPKEEGSTHLAVPGVYFTCPLTGAILRKDQRDACIREAILSVSAGPGAGAAPWEPRWHRAYAVVLL